MTLLTIDRDRFRTGGNSAEFALWIPTAYFAPDFPARVEDELNRLAALPHNWDAQGARNIDPQFIQAARILIQSLPANIAKVPTVVPMAKGNLQFEWHDGPRSLELEIENPKRIHFLKWHPEEGIEEEGVYDIEDIARSAALIRWFQRGVMNV